ncbi:DUF6521 family protein [Methylicorpusculum oleiharenae]|uniref:three component ABC system middle component n=1 Tax=Methylicorpusculum oleiharenae TaxID=1338687 RepID=UPI00135BBDA0|nr:DUF6521 family protein [Methylicorpusculum oleiharenae]
MRTEALNNLAFASLAIAMVVEKSGKLELTKALLIMPFLAHKELLSYLANGKTQVRSLDKLIVDKLHCFSNFNERYYDNLGTSLNALQFLSEVDVVSIENSHIVSREKIEYMSLMGTRSDKASKASHNLSKILSEDASSLYLNLRIEL